MNYYMDSPEKGARQGHYSTQTQLTKNNRLHILLFHAPYQEDLMSASIRLKKFGTKKRPYYRIVVIDKRAPRDGKTIEELGYYHPIEAEDKQILLNEDKVKAWLQNGAIVSDTVHRILNKKNISL
jgi:small subunit ribosomal protein S16